jgi:hypothetical protein
MSDLTNTLAVDDLADKKSHSHGENYLLDIRQYGWGYFYENFKKFQ